MALHSDTDLYRAIVDFQRFVARRAPHLPRDVKRLIRRRTVHAALARISTMPAEDLPAAANSYFGLLRQASHSARDRARLARAVRRKGFAIDFSLTKVYQGSTSHA